MIQPSYRQYEQRKMGHRKNPLTGIFYMCRQSFLADSFAKFWQNWNPLFSYFLLYSFYRPLKKLFPRFIAVMITFAISGAIHDLAASIALSRVYYLFTLSFTLFGLFVLLEEFLQLKLTKAPLMVRPFYHFSLIAGSYYLSKMIIEQF